NGKNRARRSEKSGSRLHILNGSALADVREVDYLLGGVTPLYSTAMVYSEATREELSGQKLPVHFRQSVTGALEALTYSGRPVESVPEFNITDKYLAQF